jgi:long-chain acyl-CoA synthetase
MSGAVSNWGTSLAREPVRGYETLVYRPRPTSVLEILDQSLRWGEREFLVCGQLRLSYRAHHRAVDLVTGRLEAEGLKPGGCVLLIAANSAEWVVAFWAILRAGGVVVLGNAWWSGEEAQRAVKALSPALTIADAKRRELVAGTAPAVAVETFGPLLGQAAAEPAAGRVRPASGACEDDLAVILFTSGTSGAPKGAVLSHRSIIANQHNFLALTHRLPSQIADSHDSVRILFSSPLFHTGGVQAIASAMLTGATIVLHVGRFDPARVLETIERERVSAWTGVPTVVQRVIEHPDALSRDLTSLRSLGMGGAPLPDVLVKRASQAFPSVRRGVSTNYGMTESGGIVASAGGDAVRARPGTSGRVLPAVELRIDSAGGPEGEVLVRSAALMSGYWGETEQPIDADGWLHTGDVGRLDEDGYLYIVDRLKDIVIRGGENIASAHVESVLLEHPAVAAAAVLGLPHPDLGEEVAAVIASRDDTLSSEELAEFARTRLAHFEVPSRWWLREGPFPVTITDKTDKRRLRAEWLSR